MWSASSTFRPRIRSTTSLAFLGDAPRASGVDLLPKWDAYTMGYPSGGRGRFADPDVAERLYDFRGDGMPVILVAYSGGYLPAAWALAVGGAEDRVQGVVLLDGIYGEQEKFADWIGRRQRKAFFLSAFSDSSRADNVALRDMLKDRRLHFANSGKFPLVPGSISFIDAGPSVDHFTFLTHAWVDNPLAWVLARIPGFDRPTN